MTSQTLQDRARRRRWPLWTGRIAVAVVFTLVGIAWWHYPSAIDDPVRREDAQRDFYTLAYSTEGKAVIRKNTALAKAAENAKTTYDIRGRVERFVSEFGLHDAKVLDVGSGSGYLQDVVNDYTGLDISPTAARFYHKPFVAGTATAMPFDDAEFDAAWSIWVLEHIPNPEAALTEIRRVLKPGGLLYLQPAWDCKPWAANGYEARPYEDFGLGGKLIKLSIPVRKTKLFWIAATAPNRVVRFLSADDEPTRLRYRRLTPNYAEYWQADSDAVNSLDFMEVALWFESRGDECLNCKGGIARFLQTDQPLIIRRAR